MAREAEKKQDKHRHLLPGGILTGEAIPVMNEAGEQVGHKHKTEGGEGFTNTMRGGPEDNHRHTANGQGTSPPINTSKDTQGTGEREVKQAEGQ